MAMVEHDSFARVMNRLEHGDEAAATEVFLSHGYLGASMDEVAAKAGVSKQTVYKQFENKERLFAEIVLGTSDQLLDGLQQAYVDTLFE